LQIFDTIHERLPIEELVSRLGDRALTEAGRTKKTRYVAHNDTDPSCHVFPDGRFHCFSCGATGDAVDFYAFAKGLESGFDAAYALAEEFGIPLPHRDPLLERQTQESREREDEYLREAQKFHANLEDHASIQTWWTLRGFDDEACREFSWVLAMTASRQRCRGGARGDASRGSFIVASMEQSRNTRTPRSRTSPARSDRSLGGPGCVEVKLGKSWGGN